MVQFLVIMYSERVTGSLDNLIRIGIVEREVALVLTLDKTSCKRKVIKSSVYLTLMEG